MSKYKEYKKQILNFFKALQSIDYFKDDEQFSCTINYTLQNNIYDSVALICKHQLNQSEITQELRKYFIGKLFRAKIMLNKQIYCNYQFPDWCDNNLKRPDLYEGSKEISKKIGDKYLISSACVLKYDLYAKAIDKLSDMNSISVMDILYNITKIPFTSIIILSKMSDKDIEYLKFLFGEDFHRLSGYIIIGNKKNDNIPSIADKSVASIKNMPINDPDSMFSSLTYTIPSWINFICRVMENSDLKATTFNARINLDRQLNSLRKIIELFLVKLGEKQ